MTGRRSISPGAIPASHLRLLGPTAPEEADVPARWAVPIAVDTSPCQEASTVTGPAGGAPHHGLDLGDPTPGVNPPGRRYRPNQPAIPAVGSPTRSRHPGRPHLRRSWPARGDAPPVTRPGSGLSVPSDPPRPGRAPTTTRTNP